MGGSRPELEAIFFAARNMEPKERVAYLDEVCGDDAGLRQRVEQFINAQAELGSFLESPAVPLMPTIDQIDGEAPGTIIGQYKLLEQIGEGGFGVVYLAEQTHPVIRKVALKILKPGMDTRQVVARFEAERQALAIMDHPNIARVFDGGISAGRPYFVMELVKGVPITDYCDQQHLMPRQRLELFVTVCQAVQHAHQKGIIHRDLKPSNVLVSRHDTTPVVKVIDFGVAKALGQKLTDRTLFTGIAQMIGTPLYMSPEQAGMSDLDVDTRSDIYSLGVLLYEMLTGTTPFQKERFKQAAYDEIRRILREEEPPKPSTRLSEAKDSLPSVSAQRQMEPAKLTKLVRGELDWIVMKALEKDRSRRYDTANSFALDVQRYLSDEAVQACPPSAGYRLRKTIRRNRTGVTVTAVFAALLIVGASASTWLAIRATRAEGLSEARLEAERTERQKAVEAEQEGKRQLVESKLAQARAGRRSQRPGQRNEGLKALGEAAGLARELGLGESRIRELRDEAVACLGVPDIRHLKSLPGIVPEIEEYPGIHPDLERYACDDGQNGIVVRLADTGEAVSRLPGPSFMAGVPPPGRAYCQFSPGGNWLTVIYGAHFPANFLVWDWQPNRIVFRAGFPVVQYDFSPDGRKLALCQGGGTVIVYETAGWTEVNRVQTGFASPAPVFDPGGTRLAVRNHRGRTLRVWDLATGKVSSEMTSPADLWVVAWHPNGVMIAAGGDDNAVHMWEVATGRTHATFPGHHAFVGRLAFAADGDLLISTASDGTSRVWDPWTGQYLLRLPGNLLGVGRDGHRLITRGGGGGLSLWEIEAAREYWAAPQCPLASVKSLATSPDGPWLAAVSTDRVQFWDLDRKQSFGSFPTTGVATVRFQPDGRTLFTQGSGIHRWEMTTAGGSLRLGPAREVLPGPVDSLALDAGGRWLATVGPMGTVRILDLTVAPNTVRSFHHDGAFHVTASGDGRWIGTDSQAGFKVWDVRTGTAVLELTRAECLAGQFSPDGRWLVTVSYAEFWVWELDTADRWRLVRKFRRAEWGSLSGTAFSPDNRLLAAQTALSTVELLEVGTWRSVAHLEGTDGDPINSIHFAPGERLMIATGPGAIRFWNLRLVREGLRNLGLDWDQPPYPPTPPRLLRPDRLEVDPASLNRLKAATHFNEGQEHSNFRRLREAMANYSAALELDPKHAHTYDARGEAYVMQADWAKAIADFTEAIRLEPGMASAWHGRGFARARLGEWDMAVADYTHAIGLDPKNATVRDNRGLAHAPAGWVLALSGVGPLVVGRLRRWRSSK